MQGYLHYSKVSPGKEFKEAWKIFNNYRPSMKFIGKKALAGAAIGAGIGVGAKALEKHRDKVTVAKAALDAKNRIQGYM